nr:mycofactocin precursor MftA [Streptomyces sp. NBC_00830]WTB35717.1 mycofactocin precursor MftA [Streptomyces sp. NBC_00830]
MNGIDTATTGTTGTTGQAVAADTAAEELIEADDLIEEVSIDGMCGVY